MERIERLKEFKKQIESIEVGYNYNETYTNLSNTCIDYQNDNQEWFTEDVFDEYCSCEVVEDRIKYELEGGGLERLYYFLGDTDLKQDIFKINCYGNLENIDINDLECLKQDIIDRIDNEIEEEKGGC